jgi:hypothetical protein
VQQFNDGASVMSASALSLFQMPNNVADDAASNKDV